jgi:hypothetical protein
MPLIVPVPQSRWIAAVIFVLLGRTWVRGHHAARNRYLCSGVDAVHRGTPVSAIQL